MQTLKDLLKTVILLIKVKWIRGECKHLCICCPYRYECFSNLE